MRLKSRGLGRKELVMDFREYEVIREGDEVVVVGTIRDPINWEFSIRMCEDDLAGLVHVALRRPMLSIVLRSLFKRRRKDHWTQERAEHMKEGERRLEQAKQKALARLEANTPTAEDPRAASGAIASSVANRA